MTTLTLTIVFVFVVGYVCIAAESFTKVNKAAIALLMCVLCWTLYMMDPGQYLSQALPGAAGSLQELATQVGESLKMHLGDTAETLFFLMGAMTIVEVVDTYGGFNFVRDIMKTRSKRKLLWRIAFMTFFLSAILDNLTTSIVMIMVLRKLIRDNKERMIFASIVIIAANAGGTLLAYRRRYDHHVVDKGHDNHRRSALRTVPAVCRVAAHTGVHPSVLAQRQARQ